VRRRKIVLGDGGFDRVRSPGIVERGVLIVQCNCLADKARGQIAAANLLRDDAKKMKAVKVVRVDREKFSVAVFGFGELAGMMMPLSPRQ
jgi:hypothetical protein